MPPLKIARFWDYPATQTSFKHRKHSSANVTSALQVKKKKEKEKKLATIANMFVANYQSDVEKSYW